MNLLEVPNVEFLALPVITIDETMSILKMNYLVYGLVVERPRKAAAERVGRWL